MQNSPLCDLDPSRREEIAEKAAELLKSLGLSLHGTVEMARLTTDESQPAMREDVTTAA